jgi:hypothetical protein
MCHHGVDSRRVDVLGGRGQRVEQSFVTYATFEGFVEY